MLGIDTGSGFWWEMVDSMLSFPSLLVIARVCIDVLSRAVAPPILSELGHFCLRASLLSVSRNSLYIRSECILAHDGSKLPLIKW